jgi:predicted transcriptional regulator
MVTFPRARQDTKYFLIIEHLKTDLRSAGVSEQEIKQLELEALDPSLNPSRSVINYLRAAYKWRLHNESKTD